MNEILPPMVNCCECIYSKPYWDIFLNKVGHRCKKMAIVGEFGDEYSLQNSGCVEGIKKSDCPSIQLQSGKQSLYKTPKGNLIIPQ